MQLGHEIRNIGKNPLDTESPLLAPLQILESFRTYKATSGALLP